MARWVKGLATNPNDLSSITHNPRGEGENRLGEDKGSSDSTCLLCVCVCPYTHAHRKHNKYNVEKNQSRVVNSGSQRAYLPPHAVAVSSSLECGLGPLLCSPNAARVQVNGQDSGISPRKCVCVFLPCNREPKQAIPYSGPVSIASL